jgi:hypothetical protein
MDPEKPKLKTEGQIGNWQSAIGNRQSLDLINGSPAVHRSADASFVIRMQR